MYNDLDRAALITLADGNLVYGSGAATGLAQDQRLQLVKVDSLATVVWDRVYDTAGTEAAFSRVKEVSAGGDLIACGWGSFANPTMNGVLCRTTSEGDSIWLRHYWAVEDSVDDYMGYFRDVATTSDGGFLAAGSAWISASGNNPPGLSQDVWVVKVDSLGCIEPGCNGPMGITSQVTNLHDALRIMPNPVASGGEVTVQITLPQSLRKEALRLSVVSAAGQLVVEHALPANSTSYTLRTAQLASGLFHLHLISGSAWVSGCKLVVE